MAKLKLNCEITDESTRSWYEFLGEKAVSYTSIDEFINSMDENDNKIDIEIHSCGGNCLEGWAIYDRLRTSGKEISVDIVGVCASMATVIALAAPIERRRMCKHAQMLIHKPYYAAGCFGYKELDADTLQRYADSLNEEAENILNVYVERTGTDKETLREQMNKKDEFFGFDRAKELGFVSEIVPEISACVKPNNKKTNMTAKEALQTIASALGLAGTPVNMTIKSVTGEELDVERESGTPEVGDKATPDGTFETEDGTTYTVSGGEITNIEKKDVTTEEDALAEKDARIAELEAQLAEANNKLDETNTQLTEANNKLAEETAKVASLTEKTKTDEETEILDIVNKAGGKDWLKDAASSHYVPAGRTRGVGEHQGNFDLAKSHEDILKSI